jgi:hypothetical protein
MEILKKNEKDKEADRLAKLAAKPKPKGSDISGLMCVEEESKDESNHLASGFVRSDRNMMMR